MLSRTDVSALEAACRQIGNEVADKDGYVRIRALVDRFRAELLFRPLLVEGMIASLPGESLRAHQWAVLLDSETYPLCGAEIDVETKENPLPARLRNTVAHELAHSLAFRPSDFGIKFKANISDKKSRKSFISEVESETERLSPILLWPDSAMQLHLGGELEPLTTERAMEILTGAGISRPLFIQRLASLHVSDPHGLLHSRALTDVAVGIGEWNRDGTAVLRGWPMFWNFQNGIVPAALLQLKQQDHLPAARVTADLEFGLLGGARTVAEFRTLAGTARSPGASEMTVNMSFEIGARRASEEFMFVMKRAR